MPRGRSEGFAALGFVPRMVALYKRICTSMEEQQIENNSHPQFDDAETTMFEGNPWKKVLGTLLSLMLCAEAEAVLLSF